MGGGGGGQAERQSVSIPLLQFSHWELGGHLSRQGKIAPPPPPASRSVLLTAEVAKFAKYQLHSKAGGLVSGLSERVKLGLLTRKRTEDSVSGLVFPYVLPLSCPNLREGGVPHPKTTPLKTRVRHERGGVA